MDTMVEPETPRTNTEVAALCANVVMGLALAFGALAGVEHFQFDTEAEIAELQGTIAWHAEMVKRGRADTESQTRPSAPDRGYNAYSYLNFQLPKTEEAKKKQKIEQERMQAAQTKYEEDLKEYEEARKAADDAAWPHRKSSMTAAKNAKLTSKALGLAALTFLLGAVTRLTITVVRRTPNIYHSVLRPALVRTARVADAASGAIRAEAKSIRDEAREQTPSERNEKKV